MLWNIKIASQEEEYGLKFKGDHQCWKGWFHLKTYLG